MRLISLELESKLHEKGLWPRSRIAWAALYVLALDLLLFAVQWLTRHVSPSTSASLGGWVTFLSVLAIVLLAIAAFRWLRAQLLWRLRNRLIVTYVFIGVIPVFLLVMISLMTLYLRTATVLAPGPVALSLSSSPFSSSSSLRVILSEPLDKDFVEKIAGDLGLIAVYGAESSTAGPNAGSTAPAQQNASKSYLAFADRKQREQTFSAGTIPPASGTLDREITFPIPLQVVNWTTGERQRAGALAAVETRPSVLD